MSIEVYYAPTKQAQRLPLAQVAEKLSVAGLPCKLEYETDDMFWIVLEDHESNIMASVEDGAFVFGTLNLHHEDPPSLAVTVDR